jgi:hypothetical protein
MNRNMLSNIEHQVRGGKSVGVFASSYPEMAELFKEVQTAMPQGLFSKAEWIGRFSTGGRIDFWNTEVANTGRGRKYDLTVVDEKVLGTPVWERDIKPSMFDTQGVCLVA